MPIRLHRPFETMLLTQLHVLFLSPTWILHVISFSQGGGITFAGLRVGLGVVVFCVGSLLGDMDVALMDSMVGRIVSSPDSQSPLPLQGWPLTVGVGEGNGAKTSSSYMVHCWSLERVGVGEAMAGWIGEKRSSSIGNVCWSVGGRKA